MLVTEQSALRPNPCGFTLWDCVVASGGSLQLRRAWRPAMAAWWSAEGQITMGAAGRDRRVRVPPKQLSKKNLPGSDMFPVMLHTS